MIADEVHHLGDELAWGTGFTKAFSACGRQLLLSGTPFRSDDAPIPGISYDASGFAVPDVAYSYAEAIRDGACREVLFVPFDGTLVWQSGDDVIESSFGEHLSAKERGRRYRTAISTEFAEGLPRILRQADRQLTRVRADGHKDAAGLVVTADSEHARVVAAALAEIAGEKPTLVLHAERGAHDRLRKFAGGRSRWIVAVNMVSEGVDIPRLRVGVYATTAKTPMIFRQIVGRFVRVGQGDRGQELAVPAGRGDPALARRPDRGGDPAGRPARRRRRRVGRAAGAARDRALRGARVRRRRRRRRPADEPVRRGRRRVGAADGGAGRRAPTRSPSRSRARSRPTSGARTCGPSATG